MIRRIRECVKEKFKSTKIETSYTTMFENLCSGKKIDLTKYNDFLKKFDASAHDGILELLNDVYFDDIEYKVLTGAGEEERKRSVLRLMNDKIDAMKEENSEICNPIVDFPFKSETLRDFLPTELDRILDNAGHRRDHSNPKWWNKGKDMINTEMSIKDRDIVSEHYEKEVRIVFNKIIKRMMADKLNKYSEFCLQTKFEEKIKDEERIDDFLEKLENDKTKFCDLEEQLAKLEGKIGGLTA